MTHTERISDLLVEDKTEKAVMKALCEMKDEGYYDAFWDVRVDEFYESQGYLMADVEFMYR